MSLLRILPFRVQFRVPRGSVSVLGLRLGFFPLRVRLGFLLGFRLEFRVSVR